MTGMPEAQWLNPPPFSVALKYEMDRARDQMAWDLGCQLWGPSYVPLNRVDSSRWFAPWWPYRAAVRVHALNREASRRLSNAWLSLRGESWSDD